MLRFFRNLDVNVNKLSAFVPRITRLSNGSRVASLNLPLTSPHSSTVGIWLPVGSSNETPQMSGAAHFLEHLNFKGSATTSQKQIEEFVESKGLKLNAYTGREHTAYFSSGLTKNNIFMSPSPSPSPSPGCSVQLLHEMVTDSQLASKSVESERQVIYREKLEVDKIPEEVLLEYLHEVGFSDSRFQQPILGSEHQILEGLNKNKLQDFRREFYENPRNLIFVGAGDIKHDQLVETVTHCQKHGLRQSKIESKIDSKIESKTESKIDSVRLCEMDGDGDGDGDMFHYRRVSNDSQYPSSIYWSLIKPFNNCLDIKTKSTLLLCRQYLNSEFLKLDTGNFQPFLKTASVPSSLRSAHFQFAQSLDVQYKDRSFTGLYGVIPTPPNRDGDGGDGDMKHFMENVIIKKCREVFNSSIKNLNSKCLSELKETLCCHILSSYLSSTSACEEIARIVLQESNRDSNRELESNRESESESVESLKDQLEVILKINIKDLKLMIDEYYNDYKHVVCLEYN